MNRLREAGMNPCSRRQRLLPSILKRPFRCGLSFPRADIDFAHWQTGLPYHRPRRMYACGHDIHQTVMLGVALALHELNEKRPLSGACILFQPRCFRWCCMMIAQGLLKDIHVLACTAIQGGPSRLYPYRRDTRI